MTQDFAKRRDRDQGGSQLPGWVWFFTGLVLGCFLSFLVYLWRFVPVDPEVTKADRPSPDTTQQPATDEMQWSFYDLFPESEVAINDGYASHDEQADEDVSYLLQAGSFRDPTDADALRANLILMGMEANVTKVRVDGKQWHRVMVGPIDSQLELGRAQTRLAEIDVAAIPIRVKP